MAKHGLRDPDLRRLRALRMIEMRIKGKTNAEIAQEFGVEDKTVARDLSWAKKAELIVQVEDKILRELVPAAHKAIQDVLSGTDDEVKAKTALEIFKNTLPSFAKHKPSPTGASNGPESDLSSYISGLRDAAGLADRTIDGEVERSSLPSLPEGGPVGLLPSAEAELAPQGVSAPVAGHGSTAE